MPDPGVEIAAFVGAVRRRLRLAQLWRAVGQGGGVALGTLVLLLVGAGLWPLAAWRPLLLLVSGAGLGVGGVLAVRAAARWRKPEAVARHVGDEVPGVGDDLWSAVELERDLPRLDADPLLSPALVRAHRARVAERVRGLDPRRLVPLRRRRNGWPLLAAALALVILARAWPAGLARGWKALVSAEAPPATSAEPIVADVELTLVYPAYTALPPRVIPGSSGHVLALPGTRVTVAARALVRAGEATVELEREGEPAREVPAEVRDGGRLQATFEVRAPGSWRFVLGGGTRRVREPEAHRIDLEPDRAPRVDLVAPADPLEVSGPRRVELAWSVEDDYGLGPVTLVWKQGAGPEQRRPVELKAAPGARRLWGKIDWDLGELGTPEAGGRISYWLEARDNDTVPGPNVGRSKTLLVVMYSPREKQERAMTDQQEVLEQAVQLLGDRLEVKRGLDDEALAEAFTRIHSRAEGLLLALSRAEQSTGEAQKTARSGARGLKGTLGDMHARLARLVRDEEQTLAELRERRRKTSQPLHGGVARPLEKGNVAHVAELERDVILLDDLLGKQRLEELLAVGDEMQATRDRLKQLLAQYKKTRSEALRREIERQLRELERKLAELAQKAQQLSSELPEQFLNREAMGDNDLKSRLDSVREMLARGDVDQAMAELDRLSASLDKMVASMEQDLRGYRRQRFGPADKALGEIENKLSDLAEEQRRVRDATEAVRQRQRQAAQRLMKDKVQPLTRRVRDKVARLRKQLDGLDPTGLPSYDQEELQRIKARVDDTNRALGEGDLDEARGMAKQAHEGLRQLAMDVHDEQMRSWARTPARLRKTADQVGDDEMLAREIAQELERAMPDPSRLMSAEDQKKLAELARRQQALRQQARELGKQLGRPVPGPDGKPMPLPLPPGMTQGLREAGQHMERAEDDLRGQSAREAAGEEAQALDKLDQMKQQMQRERRPREAMQGGQLDKEPVRIPGADEFRAPKEFRQDLLDAMKRGAPAQYKEQLKKYYEELAK